MEGMAPGLWARCYEKATGMLSYLLDSSISGKGGTSSSGTRPRAPRRKVNLEQFEKMTFYEILEVEMDANEEALKRAYRQKALEHHPDKNLDDEHASKKFQRVKEAFETLNDPMRRKDYDYTQRRPYDAEPHPWKQTATHPPSTSLFALVLGILSAILSAIITRIVGPPLPAALTRLNPVFYRHLYPPPLHGSSISIDDIGKFMDALRGVTLTMSPGPLNFFTVFRGLFECIAIDEGNHGGGVPSHISFGDLDSRWCSNDRVHGYGAGSDVVLEEFYAFWVGFQTEKDFSWMAFHRFEPQHLVYPEVRAMAEEANRIGRLHYKEQYQMIIRELARQLSDRDPRQARYRATVPRPRQGNRGTKGTKGTKGATGPKGPEGNPHPNNKKKNKNRRKGRA